MEKDVLERLQKTELMILLDVDEFCTKHNIVYSLGGGTALGAVRHHGFIPWDDDVDICMERTEYERFIKLWKQENPDGYYLQDTADDTHTHINHTKVRKKGTVFASQAEYDAGGENGIWIDVFAVDKVPTRVLPKLKTFAAAILSLVYTRGYPYTTNGKAMEVVTRLLLVLPSSVKNNIRIHSNNIIKKNAELTKNYEWRGLTSPALLKTKLPQSMFDSVERISFEGHQLTIVSCYDEMLSSQYGNYMQLPPEDKRVCPHMPDILRF